MARGFFYTLTLQDRFSRTLDRWDRGLQRATTSAETLNTKTVQAFSRVSMAMSAGLGIAVGAMAMSFRPLEDALARLETVMYRTSTSIQGDMSESLSRARAWASAHVQSATEVIDAQFQMVTAGLDAKQSMEGVAAAATLATATGEKLATASMFLASLFNTFGQVGKLAAMDLENSFGSMADIIAGTIQRFQVTIGPLRQGMQYVTGQAVQLSLSLAEVAVSLGILNTAGIKGTNAGTGLQNVFIRMDDAIKSLSLELSNFTNELGEFSGIADFIDEVNRSLGTQTQMERVLAIQRSFGQRAARTVLVLGQQTDKLRDVSRELETTSGAAKRMQEIIERTTSSRMTIAINQLKNFAQTIGQGLAPMVKSVVDAFGGLFKALGRMATNAPVITAVVFALAAAFSFATAATIAYTTALKAAGVTAINVSAIFRGLMLALGAPAIIMGAVIALGYFIFGLGEALDLSAKLADVTGTGFGKAKETFGLLARQLSGVEKEMTRLADSTEEWSRKTDFALERAGLLADEIERLKGGESVISATGDRMAEFAAQSIRAFTGMSEEAESFRRVIAQLAEEMGRAGNVSAAAFATGVGNSVQRAKLSLLGVPENLTVQAEEVMGSMQAAQERFLAAFEKARERGEAAWNAFQGVLIHGGDPDALKQLFEGGTESATELFRALEQAVGIRETAVFGGEKNLQAMVAQAAQLSNEFGAATAELIRASKVWSEMIHDEEVRKSFQRLAPEIYNAIGGTIKDVAGVYEGTFKNPDFLNTDVFSGVWHEVTDNIQNNFTGVMVVMERFRQAQEVIGTALKESFKGTGAEIDNTIRSMIRAEVAAAKIAELNNEFLTLAKNLHLVDEGIKEYGLNEQRLGQRIDLGKQIEENYTKRLREALLQLEEMERAFKGLTTLGQLQFFPDYTKSRLALMEFIEELRRSLSSAQKDIADDEFLLTLVGDVVIDETSFDKATSIVADALAEHLRTADYDGFKATMAQAVEDSLFKGMAEGLHKAVLLQAGFANLFNPEKIAKLTQQALTRAVASGTPLADHLLSIFREDLLGNVTADAEKTRLLFEQGAGAARTLVGEIMQMIGLTAEWRNIEEERARASIEDLERQAQAVAKLQAMMVTATQAEQGFLQTALAFQRGQGTVLGGGSVEDMDVEERINRLSQLLNQVTQQGRTGLANIFRRMLEDLLKEVEEGEIVARRMTEMTDETAAATSSIVAQSEEIAANIGDAADTETKFDRIKSSLENAREAAEGIREALVAVQEGTLPTSVNVTSGAAGGTSSFTITRGGIQINMEVGAAVTEEQLTQLERRLDQEMEAEKQAILEQVRQMRGR